MRKRLLWLGLGLAALPCWGAPPSSPVTVSYSLSRSGVQLAELTDTINFNGERFEIKSNGRGAGLLALIPRVQLARSSEGEIGEDGLRPVRYHEERGNKERR